jgi:hypothetical protein
MVEQSLGEIVLLTRFSHRMGYGNAVCSDARTLSVTIRLNKNFDMGALPAGAASLRWEVAALGTS